MLFLRAVAGHELTAICHCEERQRQSNPGQEDCFASLAMTGLRQLIATTTLVLIRTQISGYCQTKKPPLWVVFQKKSSLLFDYCNGEDEIVASVGIFGNVSTISIKGAIGPGRVQPKMLV